MSDVNFLLLLIGTIIFLCFLSKILDKSYKVTDEQKDCKHEWKLVGKMKNGIYVIYRPKCKLEKHISEVKWKEMKIDKEYQTKIAREETNNE